MQFNDLPGNRIIVVLFLYVDILFGGKLSGVGWEGMGERGVV